MSYNIPQAYFSYGKGEDNGTDIQQWTPGDNDATWVGQVKTVKSQYPSLIYVATQYSKRK